METKDVMAPAPAVALPSATAIAAAGLLSACGSDGDEPLNAGSPSANRAQAQSVSIVPTGATKFPNRHEAWRLLTQATLGPSKTEADDLYLNGTYQGWLSSQFAKPTLRSTTTVLSDMLASHNQVVPGTIRDAGWAAGAVWEQLLTGTDQLRQRVAFALSEIFVVSLKSAGLLTKCTMVASFHDLLLVNAFGNFRTLIEGVCKHPAMGIYLSHLGNAKPSAESGEGLIPDQNFARELMQLFTIGLVNLNQDGTPKLDANKQPTPTYEMIDVEVLSYVFTGWSWGGGVNWPGFGDPSANVVDNEHNLGAQMVPMRPWDEVSGTPFSKHASVADFEGKFSKNMLFLGKPFTPMGSCEGDLKAALDILLQHDNVAPFIARQLIQRLVTSNPSALYVSRVAAAFKASFSMKDLVQAVLLDTEARDVATNATSPTYGKMREPVLRVTAALRAFNHKAFENAGRPIYAVGITGQTTSPFKLTNLGQGPYQSPSVFNFFRPSYVAPGSKMQTKGLVAPELQASSETEVAAYVRLVQWMVTEGFGMEVGRTNIIAYGKVPQVDRPAGSLYFDWSDEFKLAQAASWTTLLQLLNDKLLGGKMSANLKTHLNNALTKKYTGTRMNIDEVALKRVQMCVFLIMVSAEFVIQK